MKLISVFLLFSLSVACLFIAGCSQPGQSSAQAQPTQTWGQAIPSTTVHPAALGRQYELAITAQKSGNNIIIMYQGGLDTDRVLYCTVSVNGIEQTKKLSKTPGSLITLEGVATKNLDHVVVIGHFDDGSSQTVFDTKV